MSLDRYTQPVAALLNYADCRKLDSDHPNWVDYPQQFGFTAADIPELVQMAIDPEISQLDSDRIEVWASVHAWRALAQLQATEAIEPLIKLFGQDDDWLMIDMPKVFSRIGATAVAPLIACVSDNERDVEARILAVNCLTRIAMDHPDLREQCVQAIVHELEQFETNSEEINTMLINSILDLKLAEAAPLVEQVYASGQVDQFMVGTWASVQVELGLKRQEDFSPQELQPPMPEGLMQMMKTVKAITNRTHKPEGFGSALIANSKKSKKKKKK